MKNPIKTIITLIVSTFFTILLANFAYKAYKFSLVYESTTIQLTKKLKVMDKLELEVKGFLEDFTFGIYDGYTKELKKIQRYNTKRILTQKLIKQNSIYFFISLALFLGFYFFAQKQIYLLFLLFISTISLFVGLFAPILMIIIYKNIPILGDVIFQFESKGIISAIEKLYYGTNPIVAGFIALFSIVIPILKTIMMAIALFFNFNIEWIKNIGKWSMADVFVVATLLTYFTINADKSTNAKVQIGLYFFASYVILSMLSSFLISRYKSKI